MPENANGPVVRKPLEYAVMGHTGNIWKYVSENWVNHDPVLPSLTGN